MRGYYEEDLDEYEDEEGEEYGEAEYGEEEYEEEEPPQPTQEELEYLALRQRLKESIRKKIKKEGSSSLSSQEKKNKLPYDNYGSFFGPSQPVIAQRVIQESKSLLENDHLASKLLNGQNANKKSSSSTSVGSKPVKSGQPAKVNQMKTKVQVLKNRRDYSFLLSDDPDLPSTSKQPPRQQPPSRSNLGPNSEARSAQVAPKSKPPSGNNGRLTNGNQDRKTTSVNGHVHARRGHNRPTSSQPSSVGIDSRKHAGNQGSGQRRPEGPKSLPSRTPAATMERRAPIPVAKGSASGVHRPPTSSRLQPSMSKQHLEQRRKNLDHRKEPQEPNRSKMMSKQVAASSKPQINRLPLRPSSSHTIEQRRAPPSSGDQRRNIDQKKVVSSTPVQKKVTSHVAPQNNRPKKRPLRSPFDDDDDDDDDEYGAKNVTSMIHKLFRYNPNRYGDDDDDSDMEAGFDDIMEEEKRSAKIARKEDEEQLRLIEEEERRERQKKLKKRKMMGR